MEVEITSKGGGAISGTIFTPCGALDTGGTILDPTDCAKRIAIKEEGVN